MEKDRPIIAKNLIRFEYPKDEIIKITRLSSEVIEKPIYSRIIILFNLMV
ncbi:MAG: hypothetical protein HFH68_16230 [Lachnospiraceae bacterium]|nr:hypothetical protein [Lachnospiraceae bacterium]